MEGAQPKAHHQSEILQDRRDVFLRLPAAVLSIQLDLLGWLHILPILPLLEKHFQLFLIPSNGSIRQFEAQYNHLRAEYEPSSLLVEHLQLESGDLGQVLQSPGPGPGCLTTMKTKMNVRTKWRPPTIYQSVSRFRLMAVGRSQLVNETTIMRSRDLQRPNPPEAGSTSQK